MKTYSNMKMQSYDVRLIDDYYYVYLYLNEKEEEQPVMGGPTESDEKHTVYSYDYHEFKEHKDNIDIEDLKAHPNNYIDYIPLADREEINLALDKLNLFAEVINVEDKPTDEEGNVVPLKDGYKWVQKCVFVKNKPVIQWKQVKE